MAGSCDSLAE